MRIGFDMLAVQSPHHGHRGIGRYSQHLVSALLARDDGHDPSAAPGSAGAPPHLEGRALQEWEERERQRTEFLLTLEDARASLSRGEGRAITQESVRQLSQEVKERGRARLLAELSTPR